VFHNDAADDVLGHDLVASDGPVVVAVCLDHDPHQSSRPHFGYGLVSQNPFRTFPTT
jgi:hypothetical protein